MRLKIENKIVFPVVTCFGYDHLYYCFVKHYFNSLVHRSYLCDPII